MRPRLILSRLPFALQTWLAWTLFAFLMGVQAVAVQRGLYQARVEWWRPIVIQLLCYQLWWALTPVVLHLGRRFPLDRARWRPNVAIHLVAGVVVPVVYLLLCQVLVFHWLRPGWYRPRSLSGEFMMSVVANINSEILVYWVVIGLQHAVWFHQVERERERREAELEVKLVEAQLASLKMQLQPHFLFNALNAASALLHEDVEAADRMLARLGDFLRMTLDNSGRQVVPLHEELRFLEAYLAIEKVRFADRLEVRVEASPEALDCLVPNLILQPLIENSVRHGIAHVVGRGAIEIVAFVAGSRLHVVIRNDGPRFGEATPDGVGLANTRVRLERLYGANHVFAVHNDPRGGVVADLTLPMSSPTTAADRLGTGEVE